MRPPLEFLDVSSVGDKRLQIVQVCPGTVEHINGVLYLIDNQLIHSRPFGANGNDRL